MGIEEGTFWVEHWVLYGNQFDNKFHILKKKKKKQPAIHKIMVWPLCGLVASSQTRPLTLFCASVTQTFLQPLSGVLLPPTTSSGNIYSFLHTCFLLPFIDFAPGQASCLSSKAFS